MSLGQRLGRLPIPVPSGVDVTIEGATVTVSGPKGTLSRDLHPEIAVSREEGNLVVRDIVELLAESMFG